MSGWTDERVEALKALHGEGMTAREIATRLGGCSRNAVISKAIRLGLNWSRPSSPRLAPIAKAPSAPAVRRAPHQNAGLAFKTRTFEPPPQTPLPPEPVHRGPRVALADLMAHQCRWPIGDPRSSGFGFCGAATGDVGSYCDDHRRRAMSGMAISGKDLARSLRRYA